MSRVSFSDTGWVNFTVLMLPAMWNVAKWSVILVHSMPWVCPDDMSILLERICNNIKNEHVKTEMSSNWWYSIMYALEWQTSRHESTYIILFHTWHNELIQDDEKTFLHIDAVPHTRESQSGARQPIDPSHNAPVPYPTMQLFKTGMCIVGIFIWYIVGFVIWAYYNACEWNHRGRIQTYARGQSRCGTDYTRFVYVLLMTS